MNRKILIIDDEPGIREILAIHLTSAGHEVTAVETAVGAFEAASSADFDLVICDFTLPDSNGLELLRGMVEEHPALPFIMISGFLEPELEDLIRASGAYGCLRKPFTRNALLGAIANVFAQGAAVAADA